MCCPDCDTGDGKRLPQSPIVHVGEWGSRGLEHHLIMMGKQNEDAGTGVPLPSFTAEAGWYVAVVSAEGHKTTDAKRIRVREGRGSVCFRQLPASPLALWPRVECLYCYWSRPMKEAGLCRCQRACAQDHALCGGSADGVHSRVEKKKNGKHWQAPVGGACVAVP